MAWELFSTQKKEKALSGNFLKKVEGDMIRIVGGSCLMGSNEGEDDERPIHNILVDDFLLDKYQVTQQQWYELMGTRPWVGLKYINYSIGNNPTGLVTRFCRQASDGCYPSRVVLSLRRPGGSFEKTAPWTPAKLFIFLDFLKSTTLGCSPLQELIQLSQTGRVHNGDIMNGDAVPPPTICGWLGRKHQNRLP